MAFTWKVIIAALFIGISMPLVAGTLHELAMVNGAAKGYAITADLYSPESHLKNPALLSSQRTSQGSTTMASLLGNTAKVANINWIKPIGQKTAIAFSAPTQWISNIPQTVANSNNQAEQIGSFSDTQTAWTMSLSRSLSPSLAIGMNFSYITHAILNETAIGTSSDLGIIYHKNKTALGIAVSSIAAQKTWSTGRVETTEPSTSIGLSHRLPKYNIKWLTDTQLSTNENQTNIGLAWQPKSVVELYAGVKDVFNDNHFNMGCSVYMTGLEINYATTHSPIWGITQKVGIYVSL